jgi:hypothetical protein
MALGDERTRDELLPFLREPALEEDELMVALAEEVGKLVPLIGGPAHAHCLVPLLEDLSRQDETVVRDEAVKSLQIVGKDLSREQVMEHLVPCIKVSWSRCPLCDLLPHLLVLADLECTTLLVHIKFDPDAYFKCLESLLPGQTEGLVRASDQPPSRQVHTPVTLEVHERIAVLMCLTVRHIRQRRPLVACPTEKTAASKILTIITI